MKKIIIPLVAVALFIVAVGIFLQKAGVLSPTATPVPSTVVKINEKVINVELAKTKEERAKGLSGRASLEANSGMLFVFGPDDPIPSFWMKDMLIPLDLIWIKSGKIIRIDKNVPIPGKSVSDNKLKTYSAGTPVDFVLEVSGGYSDSNLIKVGDAVTLPTL
jgi:uncharacterized membrane protein (UPF0127 family)